MSRLTAWVAFGWCVLALFAFFLGGWFVLNAATRHLPLWLCADRYVAAELEVTRFNPRPARRAGGHTIEGVIHPGGERALASTREVAVSQFVDPNERTSRRVPSRSEIEGQRLAVWYWPEHVSVIRWWHPPTVITPGATQTGGAVVRNVLLGVAFGGVAVFCFRRGYRYREVVVPPEARHTESPATPAWVGITLVLLYVGVLGLVAYVMSLAPSAP